MCKVVNMNKEPYDVYIGRGSRWGNPFKIGTHGTRSEVIAKYRVWLAQQIKEGKIKREEIVSLRGKTLGCFCKPKACHGDVIVELVRKYSTVGLWG